MSDTIQQHVTTALQNLGSTVNDVADALEASGWQGFRYDPGACPIARYLTAVLPHIRGVAVGTDETTIFTVDNNDIKVELLRVVTDFIEAFDSGDFADLAFTPYDDGDPDDL